ncbi:DUF4169 family protein [Salinarimonas soli]|uniref:DUF4169 family protein n=1 Tax=Salinarimonas soli TaxID=1638099 RepID=A0A5B2VGW3_9HYPH|nr:DUF4169 family protein [Salinarimonas soli]KAA2238165.1 DUF4169 family protein [Salinarimonas soli]
MGEIINLRQARKARMKAEKEAKAAANRTAFGRTKAERQKADELEKLSERRHEGHRLDRDEP